MDPNHSKLFNRLFTVPNNWHNVLYVHTPFCVQKCYYCIYLSKEPDSTKELEDFYQQILPRQIESLRPALEQAPFQQVYFGGGTPTIGTAKQLSRLYDSIPHFEKIPNKVTEASPFTVTPDHLDLFSQYKFSYVSLGVQTLSEQILGAQNRKIVSLDKLHQVIDRLNKDGIVSNVDLICFLDKGDLRDLPQTEHDLDILMGEIRPVSITLHSNYNVDKTPEKQIAMIKMLREKLRKYPAYQCVNALLDDNDTLPDMKNAAEYRLQRDQLDYHYYMTPKIPQCHAFGHNMVALGAYDKFKPRYNYYYIYDYMDKYSYKSMYKKYKGISQDFGAIRSQLGLDARNYLVDKPFFKDEEAMQQFKSIVKEARFPFYKLD